MSACTKPNKTIIVAMPSKQSDTVLDPSQLWLADRYVLMDNLVCKLVHINSKNDYELFLAEDIKVNEDGTDVSIRIKEAYFSDGSQIVAEDVVRSFKRLIIYGSAHIPLKDIILEAEKVVSLDTPIRGIRSVDEKNLLIKLKHRTKELFYYFSLADMGILHKDLVKRNELLQSDWKVASGAYTLNGEDLVKNTKFIAATPGMPERVKFLTPPVTGTQDDLIKFDIGYSGFLDKADNRNTDLIPPYKYTSANFNNLTYLVLNTKRPLFKDLKTRQKIQRLISLNFFNENKFSFFQKANQFFLPDSFAFQKTFSPASLIPATEAVEIPNFTILATVGTKKWAIPNLESEISAALSNQTVVSFSDDIDKFKARKISRDFDAYLVPTSMSYNVITESLNLLYRSDVRFGNNPNGKIIDLIKRYQQSPGTSPEIIEQLVKEMTLESEIIPLLYVSSPKFYNSDRLDISEMNTAESLTFWKIRVK